ncbi:hypothetical protein E2C01_020670 [Portunus trituberculatus]|uniref:Uncharacterized protein n=1 Tax=Portunus trituberculatus TaxID=210409 RepID=A0A5B7E0S8_PORTR|nr:hypothetical protein [Portunus trituberculatus]
MRPATRQPRRHLRHRGGRHTWVYTSTNEPLSAPVTTPRERKSVQDSKRQISHTAMTNHRRAMGRQTAAGRISRLTSTSAGTCKHSWLWDAGNPSLLSQEQILVPRTLLQHRNDGGSVAANLASTPGASRDEHQLTTLMVGFLDLIVHSDNRKKCDDSTEILGNFKRSLDNLMDDG